MGLRNLSILLVVISFATISFADELYQTNEVLYVWAGESTRTYPDILAIVDIDKHSLTYGQILSIYNVTGDSAVNNEPHHCAFNKKQNYFAAGGLLSLLKPAGENNELFYWDTTEPLRPIQLKNLKQNVVNPPLSAIVDDFMALENGGWAVTMMGSSTGGSPGRVAVVADDLLSVTEYPSTPPDDGCFNPHGIDVDEVNNLALTADFLPPALLLNADTDPVTFCNTLRIWDWSTKTIKQTMVFDEVQGVMNANFYPNDHLQRAYVVAIYSNNTAHLCMVNTQNATYKSVLDLTPYFSSPSPGRWYMRFSGDGSRFYIAFADSGQIIGINSTSIAAPKVLFVKEMGAGSGMHVIRFNHDESLMFVTGYFLNMDDFGKVHSDGDRKLHAFNITSNDIVEQWNIDFNTIVDGLQYRPHGVDYVYFPSGEPYYYYSESSASVLFTSLFLVVAAILFF